MEKFFIKSNLKCLAKLSQYISSRFEKKKSLFAEHITELFSELKKDVVAL